MAIFRQKDMSHRPYLSWLSEMHALLRSKSGASLESAIPKDADRVELIRTALHHGDGNVFALGLRLSECLSEGQKQEMFQDWMQLARSAHGPVDFVRRLIASLPRDWVLARIDSHVENILKGEEYDDYWMMIELLEQLAPDKAAALAKRALSHADPEIRELGELAMERLAARSASA